MSTDTVGLAVVGTKTKETKATKLLKPVAMSTCCQNQY